MSNFIALLLTAAFAAPVNVPKYFPKMWNDGDVIQSNNNCYNYAVNRLTGNFAQPGESGGTSFALECASVIEAVAYDEGVTLTEEFPYTSKNDDTLIALVVAPDWDFHWYRRDDNGKWSHKNGFTAATNQDNSGEPILSPETADRGRYTDFCGYFRVKNYVYADHEQNGGYVRIGNMSRMPDEPEESTLTVLKYSGRRNPEFKLSDVLAQHPELKAQLKGLPLARARKALPGETASMQRLGFTGILIHDRQGLVLPKGTRVQILDEKVLVGDDRFLTLERKLMLPILEN